MNDGAGDDRYDDDEIEIIEVVGVDDDGIPPTADPDSAEVEVVFDAPEEERPEVVEGEEDEESEESDRDKILRLHAEFENLRKRSEREKEEYFRHATADLLLRLLPVVDNLERALAAPVQGGGDPEAMREGVALIHRQLMDELRREGLRAIDAVGVLFDPARHEAVATDYSEDYPQNMVTEELQKGYFFLDRLLRPAMVKVNVVPDGSQEDDSETEQ